MEAYLHIEELWNTIQAGEGQAVSTDAKKVRKAKAKIVLAIDSTLYVHLQNETAHKKSWLTPRFNDHQT